MGGVLPKQIFYSLISGAVDLAATNCDVEVNYLAQV